MASFSERMGFKPVRQVLQTNSMDKDLRTSLWNMLVEYYWDTISLGAGTERNDSQARLPSVLMWRDFFKRSVDTLPKSWGGVKADVSTFLLFDCLWYEVYDFIEFVATRVPFQSRDDFIRACNVVLEREMSAYRFVDTLIAPITSEQEIAAIESAIATAEASKPLNPVAIHLRQAVASLADRQSRDFRNSMKESISAVEALCKLITGDEKGTLGRALTEIETKRLVPMHPQLRGAFQSLYTYTNDADGIRHALKDDNPAVELEDATFMLVTCSAFVNYMIEKARKSGIAL